MEFHNVIDERGRFVELKVYDSGKIGQADTHTYSYLQLRVLYQEMGDVMGLEKKVVDFRSTELR